MFRVALTTTADKAEKLAVVARRYELEAVLLPCIDVSGVSETEAARVREVAGEADWILATSARSVDVVWPDGGMPGVPVAAVGLATADAVRAAGGESVLVGRAGAMDLVERLAGDVAGKTVLFPHASGADPTTIDTLEESGARVQAIPVYATHPISPGPDPVDAVVFGSPSAVAGWLKGRSLDGLIVAAIGETTASAIADAGHQPDVVPPRPDFDLLISLLAEFLRERSPVR